MLKKVVDVDVEKGREGEGEKEGRRGGTERERTSEREIGTWT